MAFEQELGNNPTMYSLKDHIVKFVHRPHIPDSWENDNVF